MPLSPYPSRAPHTPISYVMIHKTTIPHTPPPPKNQKQDLERNLIPKARCLARTLQPGPSPQTPQTNQPHHHQQPDEECPPGPKPRRYDHSLPALLRDSPQIFFYSSASLETKVPFWPLVAVIVLRLLGFLFIVCACVFLFF